MRKALFLLALRARWSRVRTHGRSKAASASVLPPLISQEQSATNTNSTGQDAAAEATTKQANLNLPVSVLSWGSNGGDVDQSNSAGTKAYAANDNSTDQSVDQGQQAEAGSRGTSHAPKSAELGHRPGPVGIQRQQHRARCGREGRHSPAQRERARERAELGCERR